MGKSEVNPFAAANESSSSSSDSEPEYATEPMEEIPVCDEVLCVTGEDEPVGATGGRKAGKCEKFRPNGGKGCHRGRGRHPRMAMVMMMRGPPPHMMMHHGRHGPGGPHGPARGACRPRFGPPRGGPWMRRRFMRHMLSNPEFWQRIYEKFNEDGPQNEESLAEEFSKMDVANENEKETENAAETKEAKRCEKKYHGKRRERWQRFMKHMFDEMNLHASTESEEDEENHTDKCTEETAQKSDAAKDRKRVNFGDDAKNDEHEMMSQGFPLMFPGIPWGRPRMFHHGGCWARPGEFRGFRMHGDPRMLMSHDDPRMGHGDPRMGHGHPRMMFRGSHVWMFQHTVNSEEDKSPSEGASESACTRRQRCREQRKAFRKMAREMGWFPRRWGFPESESEAEKSDGDAQEGAISREEMRERREKIHKEMREKRMKFREVVQEIGFRPWMFRILAQEIYGKKSDVMEATQNKAEKTDEMADDEQKKQQNERKEKYLETVKEIGAHPWMFRVLANQRARTAMKGSDSEGEAPLEGAAAAEGSPDRSRMKHRRKMFREMAKQMGWTSESETENPTDGDEEKTEEQKKEEKERKKEERQRMRQMMRGMGWMPWMIGRGHHHHHHHHRHHSAGDGASHSMGGRHHHHPRHRHHGMDHDHHRRHHRHSHHYQH